MKNTLVDVHNILMEELERLNDIDVTTEDYQAEICRAEAMVNVSCAIGQNGALLLKGAKQQYEMGNNATVNPILLGNNKADD